MKIETIIEIICTECLKPMEAESIAREPDRNRWILRVPPCPHCASSRQTVEADAIWCDECGDEVVKPLCSICIESGVRRPD